MSISIYLSIYGAIYNLETLLPSLSSASFQSFFAIITRRYEQRLNASRRWNYDNRDLSQCVKIDFTLSFLQFRMWKNYEREKDIFPHSRGESKNTYDLLLFIIIIFQIHIFFTSESVKAIFFTLRMVSNT